MMVRGPVVSGGASGRVYCPGWTRGVLSLLRRHVACLRPLRFMPGMLNTWLSGEGRAGRLAVSLGDTMALLYGGEGELSEDSIYLALLGPRYLQYRLHHYTNGKLMGKCDPDTVPETGQILTVSLLRAAARPRAGDLELCGTGNTIAPLGDDLLLTVAMAHVWGEPLEGEGEAPWYFDRSLSPRLGRAVLHFYAAGWSGEGLTAGELRVEALHPDPSVLGEPRPHLVFIEWDRSERKARVSASPLYSLSDKYSRALMLAATLLLARARGPAEDSVRLARKVYKKVSRHYERIGLERPEGGIQALLEEFPEALAGGSLGPAPLCERCGAASSLAGVEMLASSLRTGALLLL